MTCANSCGDNSSGIACTGDHFKLFHGSGSVYCGLAKSKRFSSSEPIADTSNSFSVVKENKETVYFLQNIPIKGSSIHCRTL